ncbi:MAG: F-type H+-transporting ATPase subunit b [Myxococcota bacterium]|jgi:F-type H+-transporting ATPase subunit b
MVADQIHLLDVPTLQAALIDLDSSMFFMLALFLVLFALMNKMLFQPMLDMFDKRHALTDGAREEAASAVEQAKSRIEEYESKVAGARREAITETKRIRAEASKDERALLDGVRKETNAQVDKGIGELQAQAAEVETQLEATAADLGKRIAGQVLGGAA